MPRLGNGGVGLLLIVDCGEGFFLNGAVIERVAMTLGHAAINLCRDGITLLRRVLQHGNHLGRGLEAEELRDLLRAGSIVAVDCPLPAEPLARQLRNNAFAELLDQHLPVDLHIRDDSVSISPHPNLIGEHVDKAIPRFAVNRRSDFGAGC